MYEDFDDLNQKVQVLGGFVKKSFLIILNSRFGININNTLTNTKVFFH